jgi:hypothetical protein
MTRVYEEEAEALIDAYLDDRACKLACSQKDLIQGIVDIFISAQNDAYDLIGNNTELKDDEGGTK